MSRFNCPTRWRYSATGKHSNSHRLCLNHDCKHCDCKKGDHNKKRKKTCEEELSELIGSVADIENALAKAIEAESYILKHHSFTPEEIKEVSEKLENLIKLAIKKEIILGFLIEEAKEACKESRQKCKKYHCNSTSEKN